MKFSISLLAIILFLFLLVKFYPERTVEKYSFLNDKLEVQKTWAGYKKFFVLEDGRVQRPKDNFDTVSEGQSYAMLRAVFLGDKETFDLCYRWTENNLSRKSRGDYLLAWHWKDGSIADWMPAADADIDYALSLILADKKWGKAAPSDLEPYLDRAKLSIGSIKSNLVHELDNNYYLLPWLIEDVSLPLPVNISYYSPAHFRLFYAVTGDTVWLELVKSSYNVLFSLLDEFDNLRAEGLTPDWSMMISENKYTKFEGKSDNHAWESARVPFRFFLDYYWFNSKEAKMYFNKYFCPFLKREIESRGLLYSEYSYEGEPVVSYESSAFYSTSELASFACENMYEDFFIEKRKSFLEEIEDVWIYEKQEDYYRNSLAWLPAAFKAGFLYIDTAMIRDQME